ncbi:MAG TPA: bifunctional MaoC family dehydratase N-terminal/OB-fold nucleic acid binding domain-containing protein [Actinophytocola sp.]|jgi:hypothetical protein|uniref:bifunctional MaoC family dehydratase N-terminal/OB-fold nucleic acid binding domain-containing protein n=1 Tax=Actinophytocola sp. TaxID=1872138 RepID=UPI002F95E7FC
MTGPIDDAAREVAARGESARRRGRDPVNLPMINNWVEAIGDTNPAYTGPGALAPPAMVQVWTMPGLHGVRGDDDPLGAMVAVLDEAGFTSVVATNSEQTYHRYLRPGETVEVTARLADVTGPKRTALGEGWFVTTRSTWYVGEEPVAEMLFRILKFRPANGPSPDLIRPSVNRDTEFFWVGTARGELRIQRCGGCGELRHPPGPMCPSCGETKPEFVVASGRGEVYSYVVHHHPPVPGRTPPFVVALVELEEGVRMLAELVDVPPPDVRVGLPVSAGFVRVDDELTMPVWRPR